MTATQFTTAFQQVFAALWQKYVSFCLFPFCPQNCPYYLSQLISSFTNPIQREFDSNGAIATFDHELSAPKNKLFKQFALLPLLAKRGEGWGVGILHADTNRIQRENLFNNGIQSHKLCHAQKFQPKFSIFSNLFKLSLCTSNTRTPLHQRACECNGGGVLSLRAAEKGQGWGLLLPFAFG
jgi:hypothetical protein